MYCKRIEPVCSIQFDENTGVSTRVCETSTSNVGNCSQTIEREVWLDPDKRIGACKAALQNVDRDTEFQAVAPINICDMDGIMNDLCVALQAARNRLFDENCRAAGVCHDERFFYVPGVYSAANQEFVQATVENFYVAIHEDSCPIAVTRSDEIQKSNQIAVQQCASTQLQIVYDLLRNMRVIVDRLMRMSYFYFMVQINLIRFIFDRAPPSDDPNIPVEQTESHTWGQVMKYWALLLREMGALFEAIGNLIYSVVMDSGFGKALMVFLDWLCEAMAWLFDNVWITFVCNGILLPMGKALSEFNILGLAPFKQIGDDLLDFHRSNCLKGSQPCEPHLLPLADPAPDSLPVATRCWSTYSTFLGDAASLSCSGADTCMSGDISALSGATGLFSQTAGMVICDSCPQAPSTSFARYGCDIVTKTCKCGVQTLLRTTCIANDECVLDGTTCDIVDIFFERDTFGSIACTECATDRICLVSPGDSVGHCSCATRDVSYSSCEPTARGELVFTPPFSMCLVALGTAAQAELRGKSTYNIEGSKLATIRCDMLDATQRYCISVEMGPGSAPTYVVGLESLHTRRLLQIADSNSSASAFYRFVVPPEAYELALNSNWSSVHTLICRHVPQLLESLLPNATALSLADTEILQACVRWRAIGIEIVHITNISHLIPDTFLVGPEDFAYEIVANPVRLYAIVQRPWIWIRAILHSRYMTPVRLIVRDAHQWWVHANIEAFASANALAAAVAEVQVLAGNGTNVTSELDTMFAFSRGMSSHLTSSMWNYLFKPIIAPKKHYKKSDTAHVAHHIAKQRLRKHHNIALGHSIMHIPAARAHWDPKQAATIPRSTGARQVPNSQLKQDPNGIHTRKLQQFIDSSFIDRMNAVQKYSSNVALGDGIVQILPQSAAEQFVSGDMPWPPTYVYWGTDDTCNLATNILHALQKSAALLKRSYNSNDIPQRPPVSYDPIKLFTDAWQRGNDSSGERQMLRQQNRDQILDESYQPVSPERTVSFSKYIDTVAPWYIQGPVYIVQQVTGLQETPFLGLAYELPGVVTNMLRCNIEAQFFCTSHHYSIFTSAVIAVLVLSLMGAIFTFSGLPIVSTFLSIIGFTSLVLFISFEYSPACAPLIPTCFFSSMVDDVVTFLPNNITIPTSLLSCQHDQRESVPPANCIIECSSEPFHFVDFSSNIAWILCGYMHCQTVEDYVATPGNMYSMVMGVPAGLTLQSALYRSRLVLSTGDSNMIDGFAWCNGLNMYQILPLAVIAVGALTAIPLLVAVVLRSFVGLVRTAFSVYALSHID